MTQHFNILEHTEISEIVNPLLLGLAIASVILVASRARNASDLWRVLGPIVFAVTFVIGAATTGLVSWDIHSIRQRVSRGESQVTDGVVTGYSRIGYREQFRVGDAEFYYGQFLWTPCFHRIGMYGGPIQEGLHVRIGYVLRGGSRCIVKLEVETPS
jgi:hypothetical protein